MDGMSVSKTRQLQAFDDADRRENGIAEGEREDLGQHLKYHADSAGTTVIGGLNALIEPAVALRHGDMTAKREVIGSLIDEYGVHPVPEAEPAPVAPEYGLPAHDGNGGQVVSEEAGMAHVQQFIAANPVAADELVQDHMTSHHRGYAGARFPTRSWARARNRHPASHALQRVRTPSRRSRAPSTSEARRRPSERRRRHDAQHGERRCGRYHPRTTRPLREHRHGSEQR